MAPLFLNFELDDFNRQAILQNIEYFINQTYKLLPMREQGQDWKKPLETLIIEIKGMKKIIKGQDNLFILILCKLEGLFSLNSKQSMASYRRTIFQCLGLLNKLREKINEY